MLYALVTATKNPLFYNHTVMHNNQCYSDPLQNFAMLGTVTQHAIWTPMSLNMTSLCKRRGKNDCTRRRWGIKTVSSYLEKIHIERYGQKVLCF